MYFTKVAQYIVLLLRISMGWLFIYDGFITFSSKTWSILPEIRGSHVLPELYTTLATSPILPILDQWYPILFIVAGAMLLTGLWIRIGGGLAILLLVLTYLPLARFPYIGNGAFIVDYHIIYILVIASLLAVRADQFWGLGANVRINK